MTVDIAERATRALTRAHTFLHGLPADLVTGQGPTAVVTHRAGLLICEALCPHLPRHRPPDASVPALPFAGADEPLRRLAVATDRTAAVEIPETAADAMPAWALGLLRADPAILTALADRAATDSLWGCAAAALGARQRAGWSTALPVAVTLAVQERDLALVPALIRAAGYLGLSEHPIVTGATAYLMSQQQHDGGLGALPAGADPQPATGTRLSLTVSFVWTLAEATRPGFTAGVMNGDVPGAA
jgi:hypothetical protein